MNKISKTDFYMEDIENFKNIKNNEVFYKNKILKGNNKSIKSYNTIFIEDIFYIKIFT